MSARTWVAGVILTGVWIGVGPSAARAEDESELRPLLPVSAAPPAPRAPARRRIPSVEEEYFSGPGAALSPQERAALEIARGSRAGRTPGSAPVKGPDGSVRFLYGAEEPSIVCAVLQVCDIALQAGELVQDVKVGDPRWIIEPAVTGSGSSAVVHLVLKPMDVGLNSSLMVTTNRRTYHMRLRSHRDEYMSKVSFTYPDAVAAKWDEINAELAQERVAGELPETQERMEDLDFAYEVVGTARWKPVRVYNDGVRTVIQMPVWIMSMEAPALLVVRKPGSWLSEEETEMVNYRLQGNRYIVDTVFDRAVLVSGVGRQQERVLLIWRGIRP